jgi:hypothetical protein
MNAKSGQTCLVLALLCLSLAAALSIGFSAQRSGVTVQAHVATMQLQGFAEPGEGSEASDTEKGDHTALCAQRDPQCPSVKEELTLALVEDRQAHESKAFGASSDEVPAKFSN